MKISSTHKAALGALPVFVAATSSAIAAGVVVGPRSNNYDGNAATATNTIPGFTVAAGSGLKLVLAISTETGGSISGVTYGSQPFVLAEYNSLTNGRLTQIWYLDAPTVGSADVIATYSGNGRSLMGVVNLQNAAAGVSVTHSVVNSATTIDLTTTAANTLVIGSYIQNNGFGNPTGPAAFTNLYNGDSGSSNSDAGFVNVALAGTQTYSWTSTTTGGMALAGFAAIPEPSISLLGLGGAALLLRRRRG